MGWGWSLLAIVWQKRSCSTMRQVVQTSCVTQPRTNIHTSKTRAGMPLRKHKKINPAVSREGGMKSRQMHVSCPPDQCWTLPQRQCGQRTASKTFDAGMAIVGKRSREGLCSETRGTVKSCCTGASHFEGLQWKTCLIPGHADGHIFSSLDEFYLPGCYAPV